MPIPLRLHGFLLASICACTGAEDKAASDTEQQDSQAGGSATPDSGEPDPDRDMSLALQDFSTDPGWSASNHRSDEECVDLTQDFGWSGTDHAGETGEIGGRIARSVTPASYGYPIETHGWDSRLAFDGHLALVDGNGEVYIGFYNSEVSGFRPANFIGLRLEGEGDYSNLEVSYTTGLFESGGTEAEFTLTPDGESHYFLVEYAPEGNGTISMTLGEQVHTYEIPDDVRDSPIALDRFGMVNVQKPGGSQMEVWLDDLYLNIDNSSHSFDSDPGWEGVGNQVSFTDCIQRGVQDFGWAESRHAGGQGAGELGGLIWRVNAGDTATYYADPSVTVDTSMPLHAEGVVSVERAAVDSGVLLGWFRVPEDFEEGEYPPGFLGVNISGPSRVGHFFNAMLYDEEDQRYWTDDGPVILPVGTDHTWSMDWDPVASTLTVTLDSDTQVFAVDPEFADKCCVFDHFGLTALRPDGQSLEVYLDDIAYRYRAP